MKLYHGSKSGIIGDINPFKSRETCDFGRGFYLGDMPDQPKGLIAAYPNSEFYEIEYNAEGLVKKEFGTDYTSQMDWALFVAYNRDSNKLSQYDELCMRYKTYNESHDIIVGLIADDKMTQIKNLFFNGIICDKAFIEALQYVKLGRQYVLKTDKACEKERINILGKHKLTNTELKMIQAQNTNRRNQLNNLVNQIQIKYRRAQDVKFFDEILEEWNK